MAALAGARLCSFVLSSLSNVWLEQIYMWSDSQITLHWIFSEKRLPLFVANRVQEIHKLLPGSIVPRNVIRQTESHGVFHFKH